MWKQISYWILYCEKCGAKLKEEASDTQNYSDNDSSGHLEGKIVKSKRGQARCWKAFADVGIFLGFGSLIISWIPILDIFSLYFSVPGIVFSSLGLRSADKVTKKGAVLGLVVSILSVVICIIMFYSFKGFLNERI